MKSDCCGAEMGSYSIPEKKIGKTEYWQTKYYCKECRKSFLPSEIEENQRSQNET